MDYNFDLSLQIDELLTALGEQDTDTAQTAVQALSVQVCADADAAAQNPEITTEKPKRIRCKAAYICLLAGKDEAALRYQTSPVDGGD